MPTTLPTCPTCGTPVATGSNGATATATPCCFTADEIAALMAVVPLLARWYRAASRKRPFGFACTAVATKVPFTPGRLGTLILPAGNVWLGGDATVSPAVGSTGAGNAGLPIAANAVLSFGEEEGNSETWLVTTAALSPVDVRCLELVP